MLLAGAGVNDLRSLLAVGFVGCFYGWLVGKIINIFILPPWLLALALGGICSYVGTSAGPAAAAAPTCSDDRPWVLALTD